MGRKKKPLASPSKAVKTKAKRLVSVSEESKQCDQVSKINSPLSLKY